MIFQSEDTTARQSHEFLNPRDNIRLPVIYMQLYQKNTLRPIWFLYFRILLLSAIYGAFIIIFTYGDYEAMTLI